MRIRSITSFYDPSSANAGQDIENLAESSKSLASAISSAVAPVQSARLATIPFPHFLTHSSLAKNICDALRLEEEAQKMGWNYLSLGPALPEYPDSYALIPQILGQTQNLFFSGIMADSKAVNPRAVRKCAEIIHQNARLTPDGFTNLRFSALSNVPLFTPFFPAAYHQPGAAPAISLAVECADAVIEAFGNKDSLEISRKHLLSALETAAQQLTIIIEDVLRGSGITFKGFDFSPAPFPEDWCSLGGAVEKLGLDHLGGSGSLAAVAIIADTLDHGKWQRAGFNGMMLPVLEDSVLSKRAEEGSLTVKDMLLYSAVCGTGLDTIPLSGEVTQEELASVLMDVAALSVRLAKPLTARLMPVPGKKAGDKTGFDFAFFSNSRVMALDGQVLTGLLSRNEPIPLTPRKH